MLNRLKSIVYRLFKHRTVGKFKAKSSDNELEPMSRTQCDVAHALFGICTETGELHDAFKKHWVYEQPLDIENVKEEVGDLLFYLQALCIAVDIEIDDCIEANVDKLNKRYPEGYTDQAAKERADKLPVVDAEEVDGVLAVDSEDGEVKLAEVKPKKKKKKKWRRLEVGEVVQEGDQYRFRFGWAPTVTSGHRVTEGKYRRRIKKKGEYADGRPDPGEGFRLLKVGETIQEHDEYYSQTDGEWITTISDTITTVVGREFLTAYRRKIE